MKGIIHFKSLMALSLARIFLLHYKLLYMKSSIKADVSINIKGSRAAVWDALTNPDLIKEYFFGTNTTTTWEPGTAITFDGEWQGKSYQDKGTVLDYKEDDMLRYNYWSSMSGIEDKPENYAVITYTLTGQDDDVTLTVTQENIPDEKMKEHSMENWKKVLQGLKDLVEKR